MLERELKFFVPQGAREHLDQAYSAVQTGVISLKAIYFDTPERHLAKANIALRLRLEGEQWVQTIKMPGPDSLTRLELNHNRPEPTLDLSLYSAPHLASVIAEHGQFIHARYETRVTRRLALIQTPQGDELEMAWDTGQIIAGNLSYAVNELEVELIKGSALAMFNVGEQWQYKHKLILELRSKSERGDALAQLYAKRQKSLPPETLDTTNATQLLSRKAFQLGKSHTVKSADPETFYRQAAALSLEQVIRNASLLAGLDDLRPSLELQAEYLAAMRVGLRRLRSCRKLYKPWLSQAELQSDKQLHYYFGLFGYARDYDMVLLEVTPLLLKAGMPGPAPEHAHPPSTQSAVSLASAAEFQSLLLRSLQELLIGAPIHTNPGHPLDIEHRLTRWFTAIQLGSERFDKLNPEKQHVLRNRIKTMRYCLEFSQAAAPTLCKLLRHCQHSIGHMTDMDVALAWYAKHALSPKQASFAQQWLSKARHSRQTKAQQALKALIAYELRHHHEQLRHL